MNATLRVLLVEDSEDDAALLLRELRKHLSDPIVQRVDTESAMLKALEKQSWDIVLSDYSMPEFSAPRALQVLQQSGFDVPFIIVSGNIGEDSAVEAMKAGAHDYIMKDNLRRLLPAISREIAEAQVRRERKEAEARLAYLAYYDALTDLANRALLTERLTLAIATAHRHGTSFAVLFLDLDRFKIINDSLGHGVGDALLRTVAERLKGYVRESDTVARLGGDEFVIVAAELSQPEDVTVLAQGVLDILSAPMNVEGNELWISASIGIALYPIDGTEAPTLLRNADAALYRAKHRGKNKFQFYTGEMDASARQRLNLETRLRYAVERNEFTLAYQPQVNVATGRIAGAEALLRWRCDGATRTPKEFIPLLEETGLIVAVGEWVLKHACAAARGWIDAGFSDVRIAVNLSARQFQQEQLVARVADILVQAGVPASALELEVTETMVVENDERASKILLGLRELGVLLSTDDFGTGYSSLSYLRRFPMGSVKIDHSFIRDILTDEDAAAITRAVIAMAHNLGLKVVAEGVESEEQLAFLRTHGCDEAQGDVFSAPLSAQAFIALLNTNAQSARMQSTARG